MLSQNHAKRRAKLAAEKEALAAKLRKVDAALRSTSRQADTRSKIVVGSGAIAHARIDHDFNLALWKAMQASLTDDDKRRVADASTAEARVRIIIGGACIAHAKADAGFRAALVDALGKAVTVKRDRDTIAELVQQWQSSEAERAAAA